MAAGATILIPGVTGTTLVETYGPEFDTIWSAIQKRFESIEDLALDRSATRDAGASNVIGSGPVEAVAYGECVGHLRKHLGHPVYLFRYDWRLSCLSNARRLAEFVVLVKKKCSCLRLNFVTHSMGGLILLAWLQLRNHHANAVERAVLTVPPLLGSPMAVSTLILGEGGPFYLNSSTKFRKIARTFPSAHQLVSFYDGAFVRNGVSLTQREIWDVNNWQTRVVFRSDRQREEEEKKRELMQAHLQAARAFHEEQVFDLDGLGEPDRARFCILYGTGEKTPNHITIKPQNSSGDVKNFFDFGAFNPPTGDGDGTVPVESVRRFATIQAYGIPVGAHTVWYDPRTMDDRLLLKLGYHAVFLSLDKNVSIVRSFLRGQAIDPGYFAGIAP